MGLLYLERFSFLDKFGQDLYSRPSAEEEEMKNEICLVSVGPFYLAVLNSQWEPPIAPATFVWGDNSHANRKCHHGPDSRLYGFRAALEPDNAARTRCAFFLVLLLGTAIDGVSPGRVCK